MGLGYTIDTPLRVARFGISSVVSIMEDGLVEQMREFHCRQAGEDYVPIPGADVDHRAKRITEYLNFLHRTVTRQVDVMRAGPFEPGADIQRYFELLPSSAPARRMFERMRELPEGEGKRALQEALRGQVVTGAIDVNIMTKCDRTNYDAAGEALAPEYADARAALRGFALSDLSSSVVLSAGLNPRLYTYCESFADFFPDENGGLRKKLIVKVSDYRSASVQGRFLAKKGLWVSEFRIESGLNCGGHAFATDGLLLGPILEEFKAKKAALAAELLATCNGALTAKGYRAFARAPSMKVTAQGGIGTASEHEFLMDHYGVDGAGWGSPFLLVPEATNVDEQTLRRLAAAKPDDYVLSDASPLGVPFRNFRRSSSDEQRQRRIAEGRPGSPCYKKFLAFDSEFTSEPICTASRQYQHSKLKQLHARPLSPEASREAAERITDKECLCEGLGAAVLLKNGMATPHDLSAVTVCPGPNLAYFSRICSLDEMVDHIYGRASVLNELRRPHMFVNELALYVDYLSDRIAAAGSAATPKDLAHLETFKANLGEGIAYYRRLVPSIMNEPAACLAAMRDDLEALALTLGQLVIPSGNDRPACPEVEEELAR